MRKKLLFLIILSIFFFQPNSYAIPYSLVDKGLFESTNLYMNFQLENHLPIYIECNADFTPENGVIGGSGTVFDPFIIDGWNFIYAGSSDYGIKINNTDAFFVVRNCTFDPSIIRCVHILNAENGIINDIETNWNFQSVVIYHSNNLKIYNCTSSNNIETFSSGIACAWSSNISIMGGEFSNKYRGIDIWQTYNCKINNVTSHDNLINGIQIEGDNIDYIAIKNSTISNNGAHGILIRTDETHNGHVQISNCTVYNNGQPDNPDAHSAVSGISIYELEHTIIENCTVYNNPTGIFIGGCDYSIIRNCEVYDHLTATGILHTGISVCSKYATVTNCDVYNNDDGIFAGSAGFLFGRGRGINVERNNIINNQYNGIVAGFFTLSININHNNIYNNNLVDGNTSGGLFVFWGLVDAGNNWWGSENGPKTLLHQSEGDKVVRFMSWAFIRPWLIEPVPDAGIIKY